MLTWDGLPAILSLSPENGSGVTFRSSQELGEGRGAGSHLQPARMGDWPLSRGKLVAYKSPFFLILLKHCQYPKIKCLNPMRNKSRVRRGFGGMTLNGDPALIKIEVAP